MSLTEFLSNCTPEELTERLLMLDKSIMELHQNGYYVVSNLLDIEVIDGQITLESFKNKIDYLNSGYNDNGDKKDIMEMCAIGVCAYNRFQTFYSNNEFLKYLSENFALFLENGNIPEDIAKYYELVFVNGNIDYMNSYFAKDNVGKGNNKERVYVKSTAIGKAFADKEAAYANVLLIPAMVVLVYLIVLIGYFVIR